jgi:hypothetical protein
MRRRVKASLSWEPGPFAVSPEERLSEGTGTSFAFRPGDVDDVELVDIGSLSQLEEFHNRQVMMAYRMADLMEPLLHSDYAWSALHSWLAIVIGYAAQARKAGRVRTGSSRPTSRAQDLDGALTT